MRKSATTLQGRNWLARSFMNSVATSATRLHAFFGKASEWTTRSVISSISQSNPAAIKSTAHELVTGDHVWIDDVLGMTQINRRGGVPTRVVVSDADTFTVQVDATGFSPYLGGGVVEKVLETNWPDPDSSEAEAAVARREIAHCERLHGGDMRLVVPRIEWFPGAIYSSVDYSDSALEERSFHAISDGKLYKCLDNNKNAASTSQPTSTSLAPFKTLDGYVWKFMCEIDPADDAKFGTDDWVPVSTLSQDDGSIQWDVQVAATGGGVDSIVIENGGENYAIPTTTLTIDGDGSGARASLDPVLGVVGGALFKIVIDDPGVGYTWATIRAVSQTGRGAAIYPTVGPPSGHGADVERELLARHVMIVKEFDGDANGAPVDLKVRRFGVWADPVETTGAIAKASFYQQTTPIALTGVAGSFQPNQKVKTNTGRAFVASVSGATIRVVEEAGQILPGQLLTSPTGSATVSTKTPPALDWRSGRIFLIENRAPTLRLDNKIDRLKTVVAF